MNRRSNLLAVAAAMALATLLLVPRLRFPASYDGRAHYLRMARELLANGWAYMSSPDSVSYSPISFMYPALLGARELLVREANIALYCAAIAFAFLALKAASGTRAAIVGAFAVAICPTLLPYIADVLTEAPFVFLVAAWALCVAQLDRGAGRGWAFAGGAALALAALTRPVAMYFAPLAMIVFAWRRQWPLAGLHAIAGAGIALWILRNAIVFGFPAISAGAGGALYFGVNPLVDGFDPPYYGLNFDSFEAQEDTTHLSIHADRVLHAIAMIEIRDTPIGVLARMFAHKVGAFLFVSSMEPSGEPVGWLRAWRIASVMLAAYGAFVLRKSSFVIALASLVAYMVVVHAPLLYTHRYSAGTIDFPLALLAALGAVEAARTARRAAIALTAGTLFVGMGLLDASAAAPGAPRVELIPNEVVWLARLDRQADIAPGEPIDIEIAPGQKPLIWALSMMQIDLAVTPARRSACPAMRMRFRSSTQDKFADEHAVRILIDADSAMHRYSIGTMVPMGMQGSGAIRLDFECESTATVRVGSIAVMKPRREAYYQGVYLESKGARLSPPSPRPSPKGEGEKP